MNKIPQRRFKPSQVDRRDHAYLAGKAWSSRIILQWLNFKAATARDFDAGQCREAAGAGGSGRSQGVANTKRCSFLVFLSHWHRTLATVLLNPVHLKRTGAQHIDRYIEFEVCAVYALWRYLGFALTLHDPRHALGLLERAGRCLILACNWLGMGVSNCHNLRWRQHI